MGARVLVTGGAGFIGSHVTEAFLARGAAVDVLDDLSTGRRANVPAAARLLALDIRSAEAAAVVADGGYAVVAHLAAQIDVRRSVQDPLFDASVNILGTINLLEGLRRAPRPPRVVFASTGGAIYGDFVIPPSDEPFPKDPESPYAIGKLAGECYLASAARLHGIEHASLRFANVYGPRQDPHGEAGVVAIFCGRLLAGAPLTVFGDGRQTRDYVYVGDVADAVVRAAEATLPPAGRLDDRAFNIGTGASTSVLDLAAALGRAAGLVPTLEHAPARPGEQLRSVVLVDKAARVLGWRPATPLADGLARTYAYFAARATAQGTP